MKGEIDMNEKDTIKAILETKEVPDRISPDSIQKMLETTSLPEKRSIFVSRNIMKAVSIAASLTLIIGITGQLWSITKQADNQFSSNVSEHDCLDEHSTELLTNMKYAESYEEIYDYLKIDDFLNEYAYFTDKGGYVAEDEGAVDNGVYYEDGYSGDFNTGGIVGEEYADGTNSVLTSPNMTETDNDYTDTYNQVEGVNEADIVKTDGKNIYYCSYDSIKVAEVENGKFLNSEIIAEDIGYIEQMYLHDDKLIAISTESDYNEDETFITVYSKDSYELIGQYSQDGYFNDIRLMDDGYMYLVSQKYNYNMIYDYDEINPDDTEKYIPSYTTDNEEIYLECDEILLSDCTVDYYDSVYINLASFNVNSDTPCQPIDVKSVVGNSGNIYCSQNNFYIAYGWKDTEITRFSISSGKIIPQAGTSVKGYIKDQFSMSEYDGYFRIATTYDKFNIDGFDGWTTNNCVYVLDMSLEQVGYITDLGRGEEIKSVSFDGDKGYVVTFRNTDPLYSIDLSDPENPVLMDELKITGYSSYMQKWDEGLLLGFGEAGNEEGLLYGFKLSMFDNSDPNNLEVIDSVEINSTDPDRFIYSQALNERKALLISPEHNIIGFPISSDNWYTSTYKVEAAYVFYSFENGKFKELGSIDYTFGEQEYYDSYYCSCFDRAVIIGDYVYALSSEVFVSADIQSFEQKDICKFPIKTEYDEPVLYTYD